jgi:hypothetical protein
MPKVTVYKVKLYNVVTDATLISRRMATREGATRMRGDIVEDTALEIDASQLEPGEEWTPRGFDPRLHIGFQRQVTT